MTSNLAQREIAREGELLRKAEEEVNHDRKDFTFVETSSTRFLIAHNILAYTSPVRLFERDVVYPILRRHCGRDEFLGRITEILLFLPFNDAELERIVEMELQRWSEKVKDDNLFPLTVAYSLTLLIIARRSNATA